VKPFFPKWTNLIGPGAIVGLVGFAILVIGLFWYYATPSFWEVGYMPQQPINYSHQIHAGQLGMDCRYCHSEIERSGEANIPSPSVCMNCHTVADEQNGYLQLAVTPDGQSPSPHWTNPDLAKLRTFHANEEAIPWRRVHKLPDYVQFNHSVHVNAGVSCLSCHQRIDQMPVVYQTENLAMGWCLDCHRAPENNLVDVHGIAMDKPVKVTDLERVQQLLRQPDYAEKIGERLAAELRSQPPEHCAACHY